MSCYLKWGNAYTQIDLSSFLEMKCIKTAELNLHCPFDRKTAELNLHCPFDRSVAGQFRSD